MGIGCDLINCNEDYKGTVPPLTSVQTKIILSQLEKYVCKIYPKNDKKGTGFMCKIPNPDQFKLLPVLITNNHILNENDIKEGEIIKITFDNDNYERNIKINKSRITYTNKDQNIDATIIEIKPELDKIKYFLDIDEKVFEDNFTEIYKKCPSYILQYPLGKDSSHSVGLLKTIENTNITHYCATDYGSTGSPILCLSNYKVIGVHKRRTQFNFNVGTFIKFLIIDFNNKSIIKNKENININNRETLNIEKEIKKQENIDYIPNSEEHILDILVNNSNHINQNSISNYQRFETSDLLISEIFDIHILNEIYRSKPDYTEKIEEITKKYSKIRRAAKDANSFFRCFIFRLFEHICIRNDKILYKAIRQNILDVKDKIEKYGYDWEFIKYFYDLFLNEFENCFNSLSELTTVRDYLETLFYEKEKGNHLIYFIKICISVYLKENREEYQEYVEAPFFDEWIKNEVEAINTGVDQVQIKACANFFEIGILIECLDKDKDDIIKIPYDKSDNEIFITLLFSFEHYDILYIK